MSRTATILGKVSVTPKGAWNGANSYNFLDIVSNAGSSYLAVQPVAAGTPLDNTSYWLQIAAKGDPGQDGTDGAAGEITGASASISGGVGTPGVTVTPGGTPTARTFAFAFSNLKGQQGETGNGISSIYKTGTSGTVDTYTILYTDGTTDTFEVHNGSAAVDPTLSLEGYAADAKATGDALALKQNAADPAGLADNLTPYSADSGAAQSVPFINQGTGCGNGESIVDTGSYCQFKKKLGNTVGVNQLRNTQSGAVSSSNNYGQIGPEILSGLVYGRYYYVAFDVKEAADNVDTADYWFKLGNMGYSHYSILISSSTSWTHYAKIAKLTLTGGTEGSGSAFQKAGNTDKKSIEYKNLVVVDVSRWFGSDANIPAHLLSHPEDFGRYYSGSLAYNPGQLVNADGSVLTSIGRNCNSGDGDVLAIPNQAYYCKGTATITYKDRGGNTISTASVTNDSFTTPADCFSFGVSGTGVTISLYYSGESGYDQYYPYTVLAQIDTGSEVLRSAGAVADEKTPDGTITRKVGYVDMGTLNWIYNSTRDFFYASIPGKKVSTGASPSPLRSAMYTYGGNSYDSNMSGAANMSIFSGINDANVKVKNTSYTDADTFKTAMSGVYLYYELATPTTEQGTPFSGASADNFAIDDFGSMYWTQTNGVPQGVEIFYPYDYKAAVDTILNEVNGDVTKLVTSEKVPDAPSSNGTYVLKVTVSGGTPTYSWVAE